jgi:hypothetical protein
MRLYYWEDPAELGWDIVVQADNEVQARQMAKGHIAIQTLPDEAARIQEVLTHTRPAIYHHPVVLAIFTECDPIESRVSRKELESLQERARLYEEEKPK